MHDIAGAFHVHSNYSFDGHAPMDEIISAAKACGLDFITITDHFRMDAAIDGWAGWHDGLFVVVGEEISPRHNHYLGFGHDKPVMEWHKTAKPQSYIDAVNEQGGFGLIAHPDHSGSEKFNVKSYSWDDWSVSGFSGISIWDFMTDFQEKLTSYPAALRAILSPAYCLSGPKAQTLKRWDELNKHARIFGFGELDNHKTPKKFLGFKLDIFPHETTFATIKTHLLLKESLSGDDVKARKQIFEAMRSASGYVAQEKWNSARGFGFTIESGHIGEEVFYKSGLAASIVSPIRTEIRLIKDGGIVKTVYGKELEFKLSGPGVYRAELSQNILGRLKPWIYSNPIFVR